MQLKYSVLQYFRSEVTARALRTISALLRILHKTEGIQAI